MKAQILKAFKHQQVIEMMYMANDGGISQRRVKVLRVSGESFQAYCFLRREKRTFKMENVLSAYPIMKKERMIV